MSEVDIQHIIDHENEHWSDIFKKEKKSLKNKLYTSYWWRQYYEEISEIVDSNTKRGDSLIELGSGSGKASLLLKNPGRIHLFDISSVAIDFAKYMTKRLDVKNVTYEVGNILDNKIKSSSYDISWNLGVIEHYEKNQALSIIKEMIRVTNAHGLTIIAVPNFKSYHIFKADMLTRKWARFIPGYRLDSEIEYTYDDVEELVKSAAKELKREIISLDRASAGSPLPMGTNRFIFRLLNPIINRVFHRNKFLHLVMIRTKEEK